RWIPGHEDIPESDRVDSKAKKAAEGNQNDTGTKTGILAAAIPTSKAAIRQEIKKRIKNKNISEFRNTSTRYTKIAAINPTVPSAKFRT
ncbi:hypothetical protein HYPSUDRAFT_125339, partial [Hypholoma sublateritium FD-334 SS-4]